MMNLAGINIIETPKILRYILPEEVIPGVPWPPGFREEINKWSEEFLGYTTLLGDNTALLMYRDKSLIVHPKYAVLIKNFSA